MTIILEERRFIWSKEDLKIFRKMWRDGETVVKMARYFECKSIDIALLVLDQAEKKLIKSRPSGLLGQ